MTVHLVFERDGGRIIGRVPEARLDEVLPHHDAIAVADDHPATRDYSLCRVAGGTLIPLEWPIETLRQRRWDAVRAARDLAKAGGTDTPWGRADTTQDSLILANGASSTAMAAKAMGEPFAIGWTMADNTTVTLDGDQMIAFGVIISQHIGACHAEGVARRAAIEAAEDAASVAAVPIEGGWPGAAA